MSNQPKTIDGKLVTPGMKVYWFSEAPHTLDGVVVDSITEDGSCLCKDDSVPGGELWIPLEWCWSSVYELVKHLADEKIRLMGEPGRLRFRLQQENSRANSLQSEVTRLCVELKIHPLTKQPL